jgi:hypothetical protein
MSYARFSQNQIAVFGEERLNKTNSEIASPAANLQLLLTIQTLAIEPVTFDYHGVYRGVYFNPYARAIGRPLVAQVNTNDIRGHDIAEQDRAMATVYGLKNRDVRVILPKFGLRPGTYEEDETIYINQAKRAKIYKHFTPLGGNWWRDVTSHFADQLGATKFATEDEVQEATDIISNVVGQHDELHSREVNIHKRKKQGRGN